MKWWNLERWRFRPFVQTAISRFAPSLHSLRWKIFLLCLLAVFLPGLYLAWEVRQSIERSHLRSMEQGMIDLAWVVAQQHAAGGQFALSIPDLNQNFDRIFRIPPNVKLLVYSADGRLVNSTSDTLSVGQEPAPDVRAALAGRYGARWWSDSETKTVILQSTVPIWRGEQVVGAVGVQKATNPLRRLVIVSLQDLVLPAVLALSVAAFIAYLLSSYLTGVIRDLASRADQIARGEPGVRLETWTQSELGDLARALERMRLKLEGKHYIEEMVTTLSHELKTPLASIRGATEILEQQPDQQTQKKFLDNIQAEVIRLNRTVDNLLALAKIEALPGSGPVHASANRVLDQIRSIYTVRAEQRAIHFGLTVPDEEVFLPLSGDQLLRVMEIALDNAFQFTPSGGRVDLVLRAGGIQVQDTGVGISPDLLPRVFERFVTTINPLTRRRGTGLGLSILRSLVERSGGKVSLTSEVGRGSCLEMDWLG